MSESNIATPDEKVPIIPIEAGICANCHRPIMLVPAIGSWQHGHNGSDKCEDEMPDEATRQAAALVMDGKFDEAQELMKQFDPSGNNANSDN